jgi:GNAT superfamily N-acetyltransferase
MFRRPTGLVYLEAVTELLQRFRIAHPESGIFEAADLQWWWRKDQHQDPRNQMFWDDGAVVFTEWGSVLGCDLLGLFAGEMIDAAGTRLKTVDRPVEMAIRNDDEVLANAATKLGFRPTSEIAVTSSLKGRRSAVGVRLPEGFRLMSRAESGDRPHHMIARSGTQVAERLSECSIYRKDLDLLIEGPGHEVAAYALFWADTSTGVGLVEPVRTEEGFERQGLASALVEEGLHRLGKLGCAETRVTYIEGNEAARRVYQGRGFVPLFSTTTFKFEP